MEKKLVKQVFTFGSGQKYESCYIVIWAKTKKKCREKMFEEFGARWSMQYNNEEEAGVKRFNLTKLFHIEV